MPEAQRAGAVQRRPDHLGGGLGRRPGRGAQPRPSRAAVRCAGRGRRPGRASVPQAKQVGKGWPDQPLVRRAGRLGVGEGAPAAGSADSSSGSAEMAEATSVRPSQISTVPSSARATSISTSSGGGRAQPDRHGGVGVDQLGQVPAGPAAVAGGRWPAEPGGDQEGLVHRRTVARAVRGACGTPPKGRPSTLDDARSRPRSSPPTAGCCAQQRTSTPTCSGRCGRRRQLRRGDRASSSGLGGGRPDGPVRALPSGAWSTGRPRCALAQRRRSRPCRTTSTSSWSALNAPPAPFVPERAPPRARVRAVPGWGSVDASSVGAVADRPSLGTYLHCSSSSRRCRTSQLQQLFDEANPFGIHCL